MSCGVFGWCIWFRVLWLVDVSGRGREEGFLGLVFVVLV